jgi:hypothetical protein
MSERDLTQFLKRFAEDTALRAEVQRAVGVRVGKAAAAAIAAVAARHGYVFTSEEFLKAKNHSILDDGSVDPGRGDARRFWRNLWKRQG